MPVTYKQKFNKKYGYKINESHSLKEISDITGYSYSGLKKIFNKGIGAYKTNPGSVRPSVKSPEQWAYGRVYSAVMGGKAQKIDESHLKKSKMKTMNGKKKYYVHYLGFTSKGFVPKVSRGYSTKKEAESVKKSLIRSDKSVAKKQREEIKTILLKQGYSKSYVNKTTLRKPNKVFINNSNKKLNRNLF